MPDTAPTPDGRDRARSAEAAAGRAVLLAARGLLLLPFAMIAEAARDGLNALKGLGYLIGIGLPEKPDDLPKDLD